MTHGIYTGWDQWDEPWILWQFFCELAEQQDSVWVDTFSHVQAYVKERDAVHLDVNIVGENIEISPSLGLDSTVFNMPLTLNISGLNKGSNIKVVQGRQVLMAVSRGDYFTVDIDPYGEKVIISYCLGEENNFFD